VGQILVVFLSRYLDIIVCRFLLQVMNKVGKAFTLAVICDW